MFIFYITEILTFTFQHMNSMPVNSKKVFWLTAVWFAPKKCRPAPCKLSDSLSLFTALMAVPEKPISVKSVRHRGIVCDVFQKIAYSTFKSSIFMSLPCKTPPKKNITTTRPELVEFVSSTLTPRHQRKAPWTLAITGQSHWSNQGLNALLKGTVMMASEFTAVVSHMTS